MKEHAKELKAAARRGSRADKAAEGEASVVAKIAEMRDSDRVMAERIHAIVKGSAPGLAPKLWYGMPAYAREGKVVCFFQSAEKFKARYATLGFSDQAHLDEGSMWPTSWALTQLTDADETMIAVLVKNAAH
ncbi:iron chaperone [Streptomyces sp. NPDC051546]|uniref:iron chaperone n=1 Tax=Streptomyces sp. NPDC051546 TaxID=3365655 RepID=UPI00378FBEC9